VRGGRLGRRRLIVPVEDVEEVPTRAKRMRLRTARRQPAAI
jgi:hypothetical protein